MRTIFQALRDELAGGHDAVLATIIASSGSTPRGAGARMLITKEGRRCGTIGGGNVEYKSEQLAQKVLAERNSRTETFLLRENDVEDLGMICGGDVTVYFHFLPAADSAALRLAEAALTMMDREERSWLITDLTPGACGALTLYGTKTGLLGAEVPAEVLSSLGTRSRQCRAEGRLYHVELLCRGERVYIFGGGHVSRALVPALAAVEFHCVVLEDREDFCRPEQFPGVTETRLIDLNRIGSALTVTADDYICIMTRGHKGDLLCEAYALTTPARYIGVIGSKRKTAAVNEKLARMGFSPESIARVTAPIGLDIGGETPAEIAASVAAQLIQVRAAGQ